MYNRDATKGEPWTVVIQLGDRHPSWILFGGEYAKGMSND